jgi:hypothetical protein
MEGAASQPAPAPPSPTPWNLPLWRSGVVALLVGITAAVCLRGSDVNSPTKAGVVMDLPVFIGPFLGEKVEPSLSEKTILPADTQFERRVYTSLSGESINCGIVLAGGQKRSIHRPEVCLDGQGWSIPIGEVITVDLKSGHKLDVTMLTLKRTVELRNGEKKELRQKFLYWFIGDGRTTPDHLERILLTSRDRVFRNINHRWAYVTVGSTVTGSYDPRGKSDEETVEMLKEFIREIVPTFQRSEMENGGSGDTSA